MLESSAKWLAACANETYCDQQSAELSQVAKGLADIEALGQYLIATQEQEEGIGATKATEEEERLAAGTHWTPAGGHFLKNWQTIGKLGKLLKELANNWQTFGKNDKKCSNAKQ